MKCTMGTSTAKLKATPKNVSLVGKDQANIADFVSMVNVPGFGRCRSLAYPPTAAATAANHGHLTPMPCVPGTCPFWSAVDRNSLVCGQPALLKAATLKCAFGGTISIVSPGQNKEVMAGGNTSSIAKETKKKENALKPAETTESVEVVEINEKEGLNPESVLNGIQVALDVAGFIPIVGAVPDLLNAGIYALRGDYVSAGLSLLSAVPMVGDAAGAAKIAYKGVKLAKLSKGTKVVKPLKTVEKADSVKSVKASSKVSSDLVSKESNKPLKSAVPDKQPVIANKERKTAPRSVKELEPGVKGSWNKELNKPLEPNTDYKVGEITYKADEKGKVRNLSGHLEYGHRGRNATQQAKSVELKDGVKGIDDGGHLIAERFKGAGEQINYVPQMKELNRGEWKKMENEWERALTKEPPSDVFVDMNVLYKANSKRPLGFVVNYTIDGKPFRKVFKNYKLPAKNIQ